MFILLSSLTDPELNVVHRFAVFHRNIRAFENIRSGIQELLPHPGFHTAGQIDTPGSGNFFDAAPIHTHLPIGTFFTVPVGINFKAETEKSIPVKIQNRIDPGRHTGPAAKIFIPLERSTVLFAVDTDVQMQSSVLFNFKRGFFFHCHKLPGIEFEHIKVAGFLQHFKIFIHAFAFGFPRCINQYGRSFFLIDCGETFDLGDHFSHLQSAAVKFPVIEVTVSKINLLMRQGIPDILKQLPSLQKQFFQFGIFGGFSFNNRLLQSVNIPSVKNSFPEIFPVKFNNNIAFICEQMTAAPCPGGQQMFVEVITPDPRHKEIVIAAPQPESIGHTSAPVLSGGVFVFITDMSGVTPILFFGSFLHLFKRTEGQIVPEVHIVVQFFLERTGGHKSTVTGLFVHLIKSLDNGKSLFTGFIFWTENNGRILFFFPFFFELEQQFFKTCVKIF